MPRQMVTQIRQNLKGSSSMLKVHQALINGNQVYYFESELGKRLMANMTLQMAYEHSFNIKEIRL